MPNGVRNSIWAAFFLAGMAFMATLVFMLRPELFSPGVVREKPGSAVVLGGGTETETTGVEASDGTAGGDRTDTPRVVAKNTQAPPEIRAERATTAAVEQSQEAKSQALVEEVRRSQPEIVEMRSIVVGSVVPGRSVFGHVRLVGELPAPKEIVVADRFCGPGTKATTMVSRVFLRAKDNSLADAVIFLRGRNLEKQHRSAPAQTAVVAQRGCQFEPYIMAIQLGQTVTFENLDPILHNVHTRPTAARNREWNVAQMAKGKPVVIQFKEPEDFIRVECNVHPYMVGYVCVMPNPFFSLTKEDGRFVISNVPPGEYTVVAMHRRAGSVEQKVVVKDNESPEVEFVFEAPRKIAREE